MYTLFPHQLSNIARMNRLESTGGSDQGVVSRMGFLTDEPGFGKTLCVVGLINDELTKGLPAVVTREVQEYHSPYFSTKKTVQISKTTVIMCSVNIVSQWVESFKHIKAPNFNLCVIRTPRELAHYRATDLYDYDVIIVSSTRWVEFVRGGLLRTSQFRRCIYDDLDTCTPRAFKPAKADFTWFLTATPLNMIALVQWGSAEAGRRAIEACSIGNTHEELVASVRWRGVAVTRVEHAYTASWLTRLSSTIVSQTIQTMIDCGDHAAALVALGGTTDGDIANLMTSKLQNKINGEERILLTVVDPVKRASHEAALAAHKRTMVDLRKRIAESLAEDCPICCGPINQPVAVTCCQQIICAQCIVRIREANNKCPMCRTPDLIAHSVVDETAATPATPPAAEAPAIPVDKCAALKKILTKPGRFIVVSEYLGHLSAEPLSETKRIILLRGTAAMRTKQLALFRATADCVLLLDPSECAAGTNLTETTDIVFYHHLKPDVETQVIGRALRQGRTEQLFLHYLVTRN